MNFSVKKRIRKNYVRKDGRCQIFFDVILNHERGKFSTGIFVLPAQFNTQSQHIIAHERAEDWNLLLQQQYNRLYDEYIKLKLQGRRFSLAEIRNNYRDQESDGDFLEYFKRQLNVRAMVLEASTIRQHKATYNKLRQFKKKIPFYAINYDLLVAFDGWMKTTLNNDANTRWNAMKIFKAYLNIARKNGKKFDNPFLDFKMKKAKGKRTALTKSELKQLIELYDSTSPKPHHQNVLQYFLFSCFTGLRISDVKRVSHRMIEENTLVFMAHKTRSEKKYVEIPLTDAAKRFITKETGLLFRVISEQKTNLYLKQIAVSIGIQKKVTFHVARHTFATIYLEIGGSIEVLQQLLGHSDLKTTSLYVHVAKERKEMEMELFNAF